MAINAELSFLIYFLVTAHQAGIKNFTILVAYQMFHYLSPTTNVYNFFLFRLESKTSFSPHQTVAVISIRTQAPKESCSTFTNHASMAFNSVHRVFTFSLVLYLVSRCLQQPFLIQQDTAVSL